MSHCDRYGLPISTSSDAAAEGYREGVDLTLAAWPGAAAALERAIAADPDLALAHTARARVHATYGQTDAARAGVATARAARTARGATWRPWPSPSKAGRRRWTFPGGRDRR